jgi:predicted RNase H-like HicB family nuclease
MRLKVVLELQNTGGFTVYVPSLPGCVSQGESTQEAMASIKEAIGLYLESFKGRNLLLPQVE